MIVAERTDTMTMDQFDRFGEAMHDGRLTEISKGKTKRFYPDKTVFIALNYAIGEECNSWKPEIFSPNSFTIT